MKRKLSYIIALSLMLSVFISTASVASYNFRAGPFPIMGQKSTTPEENLFQLENSPRTFTILDTTNNDEGKFFVVANEAYGSMSFSTTTGGSSYFNPEDEGSIAYKLNNGALDEGWGLGRGGTGASYIMPSKLTAYMEEHVWHTEGGYNKDEKIDAYSAVCKIALLSRTEYEQYYEHMGYLCTADGAQNNNGWFLRTSIDYVVGEPQVYFVRTNNETYMGRIAGTGAVPNWGLGIRPCFYLNRNFFIKERLDLDKLGSNIKDYITQEYTKQELAGIYSESELETFGFGKVNDPLEAPPPNVKINTPKKIFLS